MPARFSNYVLRRAWIFGILLLAILLGCTATKRYQILSVFFDGVPDPNAPKTTAPGVFQTKRGTPAAPVFVHKPYAEGNCGGCHLNTANIFSKARVPVDACLKCHPGVPNQHQVMHGPVAAMACLKCHSPHQARNEHLIRDKTPKVCTQCHTPILLGSMPLEHLDPTSDCLSCHSGHGGTDRMFLKVATSATTQPAETGVAK